MILLWKLVILVNFVSFFVDCQFANQYLGHHFTAEEYNSQELACDTKICLRDAQLLLLAATQNKTIKPCDDFAEFSMGQFIKLAARNDRYKSVGFSNDVQLLDWNRQRKVLSAEIKDKDIRPFKIAKKYYQNYNVRVNGTAEMIKYVESYGGAPFLNSSWEEKSFNIKKLFEKEPFNAVYFFLNQWIGLCTHPKNKSQEIVCLRNSTRIRIQTVGVDDIFQLYKVLNIDKQLIRSVYLKGIDFITSQKNLSKIDVHPGVFTVSSFNDLTNNTLNWLKIINSQLTVESQLTEDSEIFIENPEIIVKLLELMKVTPKEALADFFSFLFLYLYKHLFVVYAFDNKEKERLGTNKSKQRWEQCVQHLFTFFGPALQGLYAERYYKKEIHESVKIFTKEAVQDYSDDINEHDMNDNARKDIVERLNSVQYVIGYPEEVLELQKIEEFYEELELDGTEGNVESFLKMIKHKDKIKNNPKSNWKRQIYKFQSEYQQYSTKNNIIYIPQSNIEYPFYHPNRARFFNTVNLYLQTSLVLQRSISPYLLEKWDHKLKDIDPFTFAYKNYVKWEKLGGKELKLPGFYLTNRQMFWVALAHHFYVKIHPNTKDSEKVEDAISYYSKSFLRNDYFRKDFNCSED